MLKPSNYSPLSHLQTAYLDRIFPSKIYTQTHTHIAHYPTSDGAAYILGKLNGDSWYVGGSVGSTFDTTQHNTTHNTIHRFLYTSDNLEHTLQVPDQTLEVRDSSQPHTLPLPPSLSDPDDGPGYRDSLQVLRSHLQLCRRAHRSHRSQIPHSWGNPGRQNLQAVWILPQCHCQGQ